MDQSWPVTVVVAENDIRKVTFHKRPNTSEELMSELKERLDQQYDFMLHYADPEFNNAFCNLTDITELPDRPTLKLLMEEKRSDRKWQNATNGPSSMLTLTCKYMSV